MPDKRRYYLPAEVAAVMSSYVTEQTIIAWCEIGLMPARHVKSGEWHINARFWERYRAAAEAVRVAGEPFDGMTSDQIVAYIHG